MVLTNFMNKKNSQTDFFKDKWITVNKKCCFNANILTILTINFLKYGLRMKLFRIGPTKKNFQV